ncbi:hypothetical protein AYI69_g4610 [Smittium culicis]|uniref:Aerobactin siderophore biosynthesis IucA/IucC N-terminal domain-containing protein n=1 Tax=Smittium culicis TaxID=133412 RepID=A0A1R1YC60_9FUNG|nr:hypothetical protein AYI69_g4610 [Smittium culicis]
MIYLSPDLIDSFGDKLSTIALSNSKVFSNNHLLRAQHATTSRLVSCMINEGLVKSFVVFVDLSLDTSSNLSDSDMLVRQFASKQQKNIAPLTTAFLIVCSKSEDITYSHSLSKTSTSGKLTNPNSSAESIYNDDFNQNTDQSVPLSDSSSISNSSVFVFQLLNIPILNQASSKGIYSVGLIDPDELASTHWFIHNANEYSSIANIDSLKFSDPNIFMRETGKWLKSDINLIESICNELTSSVVHQEYRYKNLPQTPDIMTYKSIDWENSIIEGHATHPMHRSRHSIQPLQKIVPETDFKNILINFVTIERKHVIIEGNYEDSLKSLFESATKTTKLPYTPITINSEEGTKILSLINLQTHVIIPVHEMHLPAIVEKFGNLIRVLPFEAKAQGQASLRTVSPDSMIPSGLCIKLPLGIKTSSALRTITPWSTHIGPRISKILPLLNKKLEEVYSNTSTPFSQEKMYIAREIASIVHNDTDFDVSKYLSCIVREEADYLVRNNYNENVVVCAALTEKTLDGTPYVEKCLELNTHEEKINFFTR